MDTFVGTFRSSRRNPHTLCLSHCRGRCGFGKLHVVVFVVTVNVSLYVIPVMLFVRVAEVILFDLVADVCDWRRFRRSGWQNDAVKR